MKKYSICLMIIAALHFGCGCRTATVEHHLCFEKAGKEIDPIDLIPLGRGPWRIYSYYTASGSRVLDGPEIIFNGSHEVETREYRTGELFKSKRQLVDLPY